MLKITQTELLYKNLCFKEFKKKSNPQKIEKILFLMQYHSLKNGGRAVYKNKTYVNKSGIRIKYMSDLLRVMPLTDISTGHRSYAFEMREIRKNRELIRQYIILSEVEINELVQWVLENEKLDPKYFIFEEYKNKLMRGYARFIDYSSRKFFKSFLFMTLTVLFVAITFASVVASLILLDLDESYIVQVASATKVLIPMIVLLGVVWLVWVFRITRATKYEKTNHSDNEW